MIPSLRARHLRSGRYTRILVVAALGSLTALPAALASAATPPEPSSTAPRGVLRLALPPDLHPPLRDPQALRALLDGRPQPILALHAPSGLESGATSPGLWQVLVYFDAPLLRADGLRRGARILASESARLAELGAVDIVLADPVPELYLSGSRDPQELREAFRDLAHETLNAGELLWMRERFLARPDADQPASVTRALRAEAELLERQRGALWKWLAGSEPASPKLLLLVQGGYDSNPRSFYAEQSGSSFLEDPRSVPTPSLLARTIAEDGWTVLAFAPGRRPAEFTAPLSPLFELVRATQGVMSLGRRELVDALDGIGRRPIVEIELPALLSDRPSILDIYYRDSGAEPLVSRRVAADRPTNVGQSTPAGSARESPGTVGTSGSRPVLELLRPEGLALSGPVRLQTISGRRRIDRVVFRVDGQEVAVDEQRPFAATVDLGPIPRPCVVSAVAYSKSGQVVGEDVLQLNMGLSPPRLTITQLQYEADRGLLTVAAVASVALGSGPERVEFFLNESLETTVDRPPFRARLQVPPLGSADFVRLVAHYPSGQQVETARLAAAAAPADELEVNLVELLAIVTGGGRKSATSLDRQDFVIRRSGKILPLQNFARWEELPLTLGLVLDTSDSMGPVIEDAHRAGMRFFETALRPSDAAFVVDFDTLPRLSRTVTGDTELLLRSLEGLEAGGETALYDAMIFALAQFEGSSGRRALVVVTDGRDSFSRYPPGECVRQARLHGVPIYLIVLAGPPDPNLEPRRLRNRVLAQRTGGRIYYISDVGELTEIYTQISSELRRQYSLAIGVDRSLTPAELEDLEVEVLRKGLSVRTLLASQQQGSRPNP